MTTNLNQYPSPEDEINLGELIKILIESKKLIVSTILIFTIASIIYALSLKPSFETSAKLEIGVLELSNGEVALIESSSSLISNLKIFLLKTSENEFNHALSINSIEEKIISLEIISSSAEQNENLLTEMINYIYERHSSLAALRSDHKKEQVSNKIDFIKSKIFLLRENMLVDLEAKILKLENTIPIIDQEILQLEQVMIDESNNLNLIKGSSLSLDKAANTPTLEQVISNYKSQIYALKRERVNSISDISVNSKKLDALKKGIFQSDELFSLVQERKILENQLQTLMNEAQTKTHLIGNIETGNIKPKTLLPVLLAIFMGFITGILLVFIRILIKSFREREA